MKVQQLINGETIPIIEGTVFLHQCCGCDLVHEVHIERVNGRLVSRWFRREGIPTLEELEERGEVVDVPDTC